MEIIAIIGIVGDKSQINSHLFINYSCIQALLNKSYLQLNYIYFPYNEMDYSIITNWRKSVT